MHTGAEPDAPLVIFDCDGVLVDSEPIAIDVLVQTVATLGVEIDTPAAYRDFLGRTLAAVSDTLRTRYGVEMDASAREAMRHALYARYRAGLRPMGGVEEMLDRIEGRICVASSSLLERIEISLRLTGLHRRFAPHIFSAAMVPRGKPAPDLFLYAARMMEAAPADCIVVEDSPAGVAAARAAGMTVFAFAGGGHAGPAGLREKLAALGPDLVFDDLRRLPDLLRSHGEKLRSI